MSANNQKLGERLRQVSVIAFNDNYYWYSDEAEDIASKVELLEQQLEKIRELSEKWINVHPSPYADAYSDPPQSVSFLHACGAAIKEILEES